MTTKSFFQTMRDGTEICVNQWLPDSEPKALIVISHGMSEHSMRYDRVASYFTDAGFAVSAHDHRGHGRTAQKSLEKGGIGFGYLSDKNGYENVRDDVKEVLEGFKKQFPGKKCFLLGHSFGSMITQSFIENYADLIDGTIICGTRGPNRPLIKCGKFVSKLLCLLGQKKKESKFLDNLCFGNYNNKIENPRTSVDWLSKDNAIVDMYQADTWCGFVMKAEFYYEMMRMLDNIHNKKNMKKIPGSLPVFLIAGKDDPVGDYGKTVQSLYDIYKENGISDLNIKLYESDRHEIFNETDSEQVIADSIQWFNSHI